MPQPIILKDLSGLGAGIEGAGDVLGKALGQRFTKQEEEQKKQKYGTVLNNILNELPQNAAPSDYIYAYQELASKTSPEYAQQASNFLKPYVEQSLKRENERQRWADILGQPSGAVPSPQDGVTQADAAVQPSQNPFSRFSDDQLVMLSASGIAEAEKGAKAEMARRDKEQKANVEDRKFHAVRVNKTDEEADSLRTKIKGKKFASALARDSVESGDVGAFSMANIAERTGIKELQTAKGAQLALAAKVNLVGNLSDVTAKAQNQWLEKVMSTAFAQVGQSTDTNETVLELLDADIKMNEAYLNNYDRLGKEDEESYGFRRSDLKSRAESASQEAYKNILKEASFKTKLIEEKSHDINWLKEKANKKPVKGTVATPAMTAIFIDKNKGDVKKALSNMKKLGYELPTPEEIKQWQ